MTGIPPVGGSGGYRSPMWGSSVGNSELDGLLNLTAGYEMNVNSPVWDFGGPAYDPNQAFMQNMINPGMMRAQTLMGGPMGATGPVGPGTQGPHMVSTGAPGGHPGEAGEPEGRSTGTRVLHGAIAAAGTLGVIAAVNCWNPLGWGAATIAGVCAGVGLLAALF